MSFGERLSTRVFACFLRSQGIAANQHDAFSIGMTTTDDFQNAEVVYPETLPAIKASLTRPPGAPKTIPIATGFLGRGSNTGERAAHAQVESCLVICQLQKGEVPVCYLASFAHADPEDGSSSGAGIVCCLCWGLQELSGVGAAGAITTLGRGGSDLTATVIGAALGVEEVQVWKDVDGAWPAVAPHHTITSAPYLQRPSHNLPLTGPNYADSANLHAQGGT